jgi:hypothetical protein
VVVRDSIVGARAAVGRGNELRGVRLSGGVELGDGVLLVDQ